MIGEYVITSIQYLVSKYRLTDISGIEVQPNGSVRINCNKGTLNFFTCFSKNDFPKGQLDTPLFRWRSERRYIEMRNNLRDGLVGDMVNRVFASIYDVRYCNAIFSTRKGIKISMEIGAAQTNEPVLLHEIIAKGGIITDLAVDTQVEHYPIYLYDSNGTKTFNDIDFELYCLDNDEITQVRFITSGLSCITILR